MRLTVIFASLLCILSVTVFAFASSTETVWLHTNDKYPLKGKFRIHRDPTGNLSVSDVAALDRNGEFRPIAENLNVGFTSDVIWLAFSVRNHTKTSTDWWLEITSPLLEHIDLYTISADSPLYATVPEHSERTMSVSALKIGYHATVYPISIADDKPCFYYLRIQSNTAIYLRATIWQPSAFTKTIIPEMHFVGVYYVLWLTIALLSLAQWWLSKQRVHGWWALYALCDGFFIFSLSGVPAQYLAPNHPEVASIIPGLSLCMTIMAFCSVCVELYDIRSFSLLAMRCVRTIALASMLCGGMLILRGTTSVTLVCVQLTGLAVTVLSLLLAIRSVRKHQYYAVWYLSSSAILAISILIVVARNFGMIAPYQIVDYLLHINILSHIILLNIGMVRAVRTNKRSRVRAKKRAERIQSTMQSLNEQKKYVALLSHEFHNMLGVINGALYNLQRVNHDAPTEVLTRYKKIEKTSQHLQNLVDNFLTNERISFGLRRSKFDFPSIVFETILLAQARTNTHHILLDAPTLPADLCGDQEFLKVALLNVLLNAIKYSPRGGDIVVSIRHNDALQITIRDQGIGIAPDELSHIFDKYYRVLRTGSPGVGLGLHLVKSIIELHGGQVTAESTEGVGTSVLIQLPLQCRGLDNAISGMKPCDRQVTLVLFSMPPVPR